MIAAGIVAIVVGAVWLVRWLISEADYQQRTHGQRLYELERSQARWPGDR